jgi:hypothetical protein
MFSSGNIISAPIDPLPEQLNPFLVMLAGACILVLFRIRVR